MGCTALSLELARNNLTPCCYAELYCKEHGELRLTLAEIPPSFYPCPVCRTLALCVPLGEGGTRKGLPFWQPRSLNATMAAKLWRLLKAQSSI